MEREIASKMNGSFKSWMLGAAVGLVTTRADALLAGLLQNPMLTALHLVEGEMVDVDAIYGELLKQAQKSSATISLPLVGTVTFKENDVEALYRYIKEVS
jgi:hypothetical protein